MPGLGDLNKRGDANVVSVSCSSAGNCAAGGHFTDGRGHQQGFVTQDGTRTRPARSASPFANILDKRT